MDVFLVLIFIALFQLGFAMGYKAGKSNSGEG
jgi:hypothetical protein